MSKREGRLFRILFSTQLFWVLSALAICIWWGHLILEQAKAVSALSLKLGVDKATASKQLAKMHRIVYWEAAFFIFLIIGTSGWLFWLFRRDLRRHKRTQSFFAGVSHELRTPLTSIRLQAEAISQRLSNAPSEAKLVRRMLEDTSRLESQVERTLELARVEGGGRVFTRPLDLGRWMGHFINEWSQVKKSDTSVRTKIDRLLIEADTSAMQVIVRNLLENSIKHSGRKSVEIDITAEKAGRWIVCRYQDNGIKHSEQPEDLGALFQKGEHSQGAGVGLYLVQSLMNRMGGHAEFRLEQGFRAQLWFKSGAPIV